MRYFTIFQWRCPNHPCFEPVRPRPHSTTVEGKIGLRATSECGWNHASPLQRTWRSIRATGRLDRSIHRSRLNLASSGSSATVSYLLCQVSPRSSSVGPLSGRPALRHGLIRARVGSLRRHVSNHSMLGRSWPLPGCRLLLCAGESARGDRSTASRRHQLSSAVRLLSKCLLRASAW